MFRIDEILKAAKARLIQGKEDTLLSGISTDTRCINQGEAFIAIKGNNFDGHKFIKEAVKKGAKAIISRRSGYPVSCLPKDLVFIEVKDTVRALGDIARLHRNKFNIPIIAVTGSNGKTTTKEMISCVLSGKLNVLKNEGTKNNQIGLPLALLGLNSSYNIAVLELGTNHFGEIGYLAGICQPNIGIITNIGAAHLEYFHNLKNVFKEKNTLIGHLKEPYIAILNSDDKFLNRQAAKKSKGPFILGVGMRNKTDFFASEAKVANSKTAFLCNKKFRFTLRTIGVYNIYNSLAAIAVGRIFGFGYRDIALRLANFEFPQGRLRPVEFNKIKFIDDTYNSNPDSLKQALDTLHNFKIKGRKIFIMGDMLELGKKKTIFHRQAGYSVGRLCDVFVAVGRLSNLAALAARDGGLDINNIYSCKTSQEASDILFKKILPNQDDIVLVKGSRLMKMERIFK